MDENSKISRQERNAFEKGYKLELTYKHEIETKIDDLKKQINQVNMQYERFYVLNSNEVDIQALELQLQRLRDSLVALEAGKNARLRDKTDEYLLQDRLVEYERKRNLKNTRNNLVAKKEASSKKTLDYIKYGIPLVIGIGTLVYRIPIFETELANLSFSMIAGSALTAIPVATYAWKNHIKDEIEKRKIEQRRKADKNRRTQEKKDIHVEAPSREQFAKEIRVPIVPINSIDPIERRVDAQLEVFERKNGLLEGSTASSGLRSALIAREKNNSKYSQQINPILTKKAMLNESVKKGEITENEAARIRRELDEKLEEIYAAERKEFEVALKRRRNNGNQMMRGEGKKS